MDGTIQAKQDPDTASDVSHPPPHQANTNQQNPYPDANISLNQQLPTVSTNQSIRTCSSSQQYAHSHSNAPLTFNDSSPIEGMHSFLNHPPGRRRSPYMHLNDLNQPLPPIGSSPGDDPYASIPPARRPQNNLVRNGFTSSSPVVNIHIHSSIYVNGSSPSNQYQQSSTGSFHNTTPFSFQHQTENRVDLQSSAFQGPSRPSNNIQFSSKRSFDMSSGGPHEPQLFVNSASSTPSQNKANWAPRGYNENTHHSSPSTANYSSPQVQELPSLTPTHSQSPALNQINRLPSSPFATGSNRPPNSTTKSSSVPIATPKTSKRKFKMSMDDLESTFRSWSGAPKPRTRSGDLGEEQKFITAEKKPEMVIVNTNTQNSKLTTYQECNTNTVGTSAPNSTYSELKIHNPPLSKPTSHTTPAVEPNTIEKEPEMVTTRTSTQDTKPAFVQVSNSQAIGLSATNSSLPKSSTVQNVKPIVIELSDDDSEVEATKPFSVAPETSIIVIGSDDEDEAGPIAPTNNSKHEKAMNTSLISSPISVKPRFDFKNISDSITDSSFSFTKVDTKHAVAPEAKKPPKLGHNTPVQESKDFSDDNPFDLPPQPAFIQWLSSDEEDYAKDIALGTRTTTSSIVKNKADPIVSESLPIHKDVSNTRTVGMPVSLTNRSTGNLNYQKTGIASRSKSVSSARFSRPATEISLKPVKRASTTQDGESSTAKKAKKSKTDSLLAELPKIDNFEYSYKELQEANRVNRKKEELHAEMEIYISMKPYNVLKEFTEEFKSKVATFESELPLVYWNRNAKAEYIKEKDYFIPTAAKKVVQQTFVMYYLAQDFLDKLHSNKLKNDVLKGTEEMCKISTHKYHVILLVEGYDQLINKIKSYKQRQFRSQVLNGEEQSKKKKDDEQMSKFPEPIEIAKLFNRAQLDLKVNIFPVRSRQEGVMWLNSFTYTIGSALYDKYERNQGLANLGVVRSGSDTKATFLQSIQHFPRMTHSKAQILQSSHGSMYSIYSKFCTSGTLGKDTLGRNIVPPSVDSTMLNFFTSDDPDKAIT
ncbi:Mms4 protein [Candida orthopsilosis Co 90-125]|uniref:Mms4 protein n=1 Tax=Candida orthopsilosis (strain 90-125) TaxID=1136231 RepID=H8X9F2_CANO9|nr:Mms4 protein [Candida orthopsilosis Co 90-125]CCG24618.1 Mms4 protein [Candida orthopsilosis Co 90-125]